MNTKSFILFIALLFAHFAGSSAHAQSRKFGVGVLVGGSKLQGDIENTNTALMGGLILRYAPVSFFAISANSSYGKMASGLNALKTQLFNTSLSGTFFLWPNSRHRPFVSVGISNFYYAAQDGNGRQLHYPDGSKVAGWETALQVGIGFELFASRNWAINTVGDYVLSKNDALDGIVQGKNDQFFSGTLGLVRYFGGGKSKAAMPDEIGDANQAPSRTQATTVSKSESRPYTQVLKTSVENSNGIYFEPGTDVIRARSKARLYQIFQYLSANPREEIQLIASEDEKKKDMDLMIRRAGAVKRYLTDLGVAPSRIIIDLNAD